MSVTSDEVRRLAAELKLKRKELQKQQRQRLNDERRRERQRKASLPTRAEIDRQQRLLLREKARSVAWLSALQEAVSVEVEEVERLMAPLIARRDAAQLEWMQQQMEHYNHLATWQKMIETMQ